MKITVDVSEAQKPLKVIAGAPDKPLIIGEAEILCYVLEDEMQEYSAQTRLTVSGIGIRNRRVEFTNRRAKNRLAHF